MSDFDEVEFVEVGAPIDLDNCAREPIHIPGSVQPRGACCVLRLPLAPALPTMAKAT